jgi:imidazoleglycerol phosphate synthase glutamine amidotransferase subunit HisH
VVRESGLLPVLHAAAHKPLFGVCGMQMLRRTVPKGAWRRRRWYTGEPDPWRFSSLISGQTRMTAAAMPQMEGDRVHPTPRHPIWDGVPDGCRYFVHSFYARPSDARHTQTLPTMAAATVTRLRDVTPLVHPKARTRFGLVPQLPAGDSIVNVQRCRVCG